MEHIIMIEQIISFETAKLADEKGLNIIWRNELYTNDGVLHPHMAHWLCGYEKIINAPTQALLQKWLREIHKIEIDIKSIINGYQYSIWKRDKDDGLNENGEIEWIDGGSIYEETLETALQVGLNMIETIKNETK